MFKKHNFIRLVWVILLFSVTHNYRIQTRPFDIDVENNVRGPSFWLEGEVVAVFFSVYFDLWWFSKLKIQSSHKAAWTIQECKTLEIKRTVVYNRLVPYIFFMRFSGIPLYTTGLLISRVLKISSGLLTGLNFQFRKSRMFLSRGQGDGQSQRVHVPVRSRNVCGNS